MKVTYYFEISDHFIILKNVIITMELPLYSLLSKENYLRSKSRWLIFFMTLHLSQICVECKLMAA